jgi:hypothetical protein
MHERGSHAEFPPRQSPSEIVTSDGLGRELIRILMLAAFLPVARITSPAG